MKPEPLLSRREFTLRTLKDRGCISFAPVNSQDVPDWRRVAKISILIRIMSSSRKKLAAEIGENQKCKLFFDDHNAVLKKSGHGIN